MRGDEEGVMSISEFSSGSKCQVRKTDEADDTENDIRSSSRIDRWVVDVYSSNDVHQAESYYSSGTPSMEYVERFIGKAGQVADEVIFACQTNDKREIGIYESSSMMRLPGNIAMSARKGQRQVESEIG